MNHKEIEKFIKKRLAVHWLWPLCTRTTLTQSGLMHINVKGYMAKRVWKATAGSRPITWAAGCRMRIDRQSGGSRRGRHSGLSGCRRKRYTLPTLRVWRIYWKRKACAKKIITVVGGPRVSHEFALELGFDAGFGPGTLPTHVGSYLAQKWHAVWQSNVSAAKQSSATALKESSHREILKIYTYRVDQMEVMIRLRISQADAHYGGDLVDGARMLALFGDVATELLIRRDGDEGLL